jgi:hypothetical protein
MVRWLLVLALVATQLQSWSGGALYLCLKTDGSFCCIDEGPDSCTCCDHDHHEAPASQPIGWNRLDPGSRTHVLVLCERAPIVCRTSATTVSDDDRRDAIPFGQPFSATVAAGLESDRTCRLAGSICWAPSSADFCSVVLRC